MMAKSPSCFSFYLGMILSENRVTLFRIMPGSRFAQEHVIRGIRHAAARLLVVAGALQYAADRVDPLHRGDVGELAAALVRGDLELQPGNVIGASTGGIASGLGGDAAAVGEFPGWPRRMITNDLVVDRQRRLR